MTYFRVRMTRIIQQKWLSYWARMVRLVEAQRLEPPRARAQVRALLRASLATSGPSEETVMASKQIQSMIRKVSGPTSCLRAARIKINCYDIHRPERYIFLKMWWSIKLRLRRRITYAKQRWWSVCVVVGSQRRQRCRVSVGRDSATTVKTNQLDRKRSSWSEHFAHYKYLEES